MVAPQFFEVDVHVDGRKVGDVPMLVTLDWSADQAEFGRRQLNAQLWAAAVANRAIAADLRVYALWAWRLDGQGQRTGRLPVWTWLYQPSASELDREDWWRL